MTIRIAHASDTHNQPSIVRQVADLDVDVLLLTGDMMGNKVNRMYGETVDAITERAYQTGWFRKHAKKWAQDLNGRPVISVPGNHDFISITTWLRHYGVTVLEITDENPMVEFMGVRFAGFRQVEYLAGEWVGEVRDFDGIIDRAFNCNPRVLVGHSPPAGILEYGDNEQDRRGIGALNTALFRTRDHNVTDHFFGHAHESGGQSVTLGGINFHNGAGHIKVHTIG